MKKIYKIFILFLSVICLVVNFSPGINAASEIIDGQIDGIELSYKGCSTIYKRKNAILLSSDIYSLTYKNWIITDISDLYDVDSYYVEMIDDNYTGNGSTLGTYDITLKLFVTLKDLSSDKKITVFNQHSISILVVDNISANFMYDNHYYYHFNNLPNGEEFMWMLFYNNQLPSSNDLYIKYYSNNFDENLVPIEKIEAGEYLVRYEYISQSGYNGSGSCYIHLSEALVNINSNTNDSIYLVIGLFLIIGTILIILNSKKKKGYKFK